MQTSGVFPQLYAGLKKTKPGAKPAPKRSRTPGPPEDGAGWTSRQPRPINAPKTTAGRRDAASMKATGFKYRGK